MKGFKYEDTVNRWGVFEAELMGPDEGNPFRAILVHHMPGILDSHRPMIPFSRREDKEATCLFVCKGSQTLRLYPGRAQVLPL